MSNLLDNEIGTEILVAELLICSAGHRLLNMWLQLDIHPATNIKRALLAMLIRLVFHTLLSMVQIVLDML